MIDGDDAVISALDRLRFLLAARVDFSATDTQSTEAKVRILSAAATYFNVIAVTEYGGRPGPPRAPGLVEQVVGAAFQSFGGEDPHPTHFDKGAMLLRGITQGHPFTDGNKRTGFLTAAYYLERVGYAYPDPIRIDAVVGLCVRVSSGEIRDVAIIAQEMWQIWNEGGGLG